MVYWAKVVSLGMILGLGLQFAQAWVPPTVAPPGGNVSGPLTVGSLGQIKAGNLVLNSDNTLATGLLMYGGLNVQATTLYNGAGAEGIIHDPQSYADLVLEGKTGWGGNLRFFNNGLPRGDFSYVVTPSTGMESFRFFTGGDTTTPKMVVNNNGNVGVGTVTPAAKLEVNGEFRLGANATAGTICNLEGKVSFDFGAHAPVYCNNTGVWTVMAGGGSGSGSVVGGCSINESFNCLGMGSSGYSCWGGASGSHSQNVYAPNIVSTCPGGSTKRVMSFRSLGLCSGEPDTMTIPIFICTKD